MTVQIHQIPTSRAALTNDELEVQSAGGGQSARVTAQSVADLGGGGGLTLPITADAGPSDIILNSDAAAILGVDAANNPLVGLGVYSIIGAGSSAPNAVIFGNSSGFELGTNASAVNSCVFGTFSGFSVPDDGFAENSIVIGSGCGIFACAIANRSTVVGSTNNLGNIATNASDVVMLGSVNVIDGLDDVNESVLIGNSNTLTGSGSGGTAVATHLIGQGNTFNVADNTSVTDSGFCFGWDNTFNVASGATWLESMAIGIHNTVNYANCAVYGRTITPTAANQTWLGDSVNPVYLQATKLVFVGMTAAPDSALLEAGQFALWFDDTDGAAALNIKAKQANGTVKTATIAVTT